MTETAPPPPGPRTLHKTYAIGMVGIGLMDLYALIVPLYALSIGASATEIGLLLGARSLLPLLFAIHGGSLMDRLGTRRVLLFTSAAVAVLALNYPLLPWIPALLVLQLASGLFMTFNWIGAQTLIAQVCHGEAEALGKFNFFCRFGTVVGPIMAGLIWDLGGAWPTFIMISAWAMLMYFLVRHMPETTPAVTDGRAAGQAKPSLRDAMPRISDYTRSFSLMLIPVIAFTVAVAGFRNGASGIQNTIYVVYLESIGFQGTLIGILFATLEIAIGCASLVVGAVKRLGRAEWVLLVTTFAAISFIAMTPFLGGIFLLLLLMQLFRGMAQGFMQPLMFSIQSITVGRDYQGAVVGLRMTANRLFSVALPPILGFFADWVGLEGSFAVAWALLTVGLIGLAIVVIRRPEFRVDS